MTFRDATVLDGFEIADPPLRSSFAWRETVNGLLLYLNCSISSGRTLSSRASWNASTKVRCGVTSVSWSATTSFAPSLTRMKTKVTGMAHCLPSNNRSDARGRRHYYFYSLCPARSRERLCFECCSAISEKKIQHIFLVRKSK